MVKIMICLTDEEIGQNDVWMWKDKHYIVLQKDSEKGRKYYRYDLSTNKFERINIKGYNTTINPQKTQYMTGWIKDCNLKTKDKKFARMFFWTKANPKIKRYKSTIRFIEQFGHELTQMFEAIDILDITIPYIEKIIEERKQFQKTFFLETIIVRLHKILTNKKEFKQIKFIESILQRPLSTDEIFYFSNFSDKQNKIFARLYNYANKEAYENLFILKSRWGNELKWILKSDDFGEYDFNERYLREEMIDVIKDYNIDVDVFVNYLNKLYHIEKIDFTDLFGSHHYRDYLNMQREIHHGRLSKIDKYPINFMTAFHRTKKQYDTMKQEIDKEKFKKVVKKHKHLNYKNKKYSIMVAEHPIMIEEEGDILHHCVRSYIKPMTEGRTCILMLRKNKDIKTPLVTIECKNGKITQAYGSYDKKPKEEELNFIRQWANKKELELVWKWE